MNREIQKLQGFGLGDQKHDPFAEDHVTRCGDCNTIVTDDSKKICKGNFYNGVRCNTCFKRYMRENSGL